MTTLTANGLSCKSGDGSVKHEYTPRSEPNAERMSSNPTDDLQSSSNHNSNYTPIRNQSKNDEKLNDYSQKIIESLQLIKDLDLFLVTAPVNWHENQVIRRYFLNKEEGFVSCVYWNNLYFITGTDIVRCIAYKMYHIGREIVDRKKFEEGIFSDLRALKTGTHSILENSRSPFLKFLHRNQCLRTQKKQKVFFWFSVPHNKLFADVLERDLKKELSNQSATTKPISDVIRSFKYDQSLPLLEQLSKHYSHCLGEDVSTLILKTNNINPAVDNSNTNNKSTNNSNSEHFDAEFNHNQPSPIRNLPCNSNTLNNTNVTNTQLSDDFPLDFLDPSLSLVNENYITSISSLGGLKSANKYYSVQPNFNDESIVSPRHNSQHQVYQQFQHQPQSAGFPDQIDSYILNPYGQSLMSATYQQQQNQPMYIFSGLPSTIDPTNTMSNINQQQGNNSPMQSTNTAHIFPLSMQQSVPTYLVNNEGIPMDQVLVNNDLSNPNLQLLSQIIRSQSPTVSTNNAASYLSLPSAGLIPISIPLPSSTVKLSNQHENSMSSINKKNDGQTEIGSNDESILIETGGIDDPTVVDQKLNDSNDITGSNNPPMLAGDDTKVKLEEYVENSTIPLSATTQQRSDYMMLAMPPLVNNGLLNFGIVGGQLITPGAVNGEYSMENPVMSAGVGLSPVIGFNNGLLSAIQYQTRQNICTKQSDLDDSEEQDADINKIISGSDEKTEKRLKSILQNGNNNYNNKSNISKSKAPKTTATKRRFLNPTLQHLELDSIFDDSELSSDEDESGQQNSETIQQRKDNLNDEYNK